MVTLIGTRHSEFGACNSDELLKVVEKVSPRIIFEEVPPSQFEAIYKGELRDSLETFTIKRYMQKSQVNHIPVDLDSDYSTKSGFRDDYRKMTFIFSDHSEEYLLLSNEFTSLVEKYGFPYLNSEECSTLLKYVRSLERKIVEELNLERLSLAFKNWRDYNENREREMISNICNFIDSNGYEECLFLVGAEHRSSIIEKIQENEIERETIWNFNYFA